MSTNNSNYDRLKELKAFDDLKAGVKGLVDTGLTKVPQIFIHPSENLHTANTYNLQIPVIDLDDTRNKDNVIREIREASETWGFFQVVNHGIPIHVLEEMLQGVLRFYEEPNEVKVNYFTRAWDRKVRYGSNFDLYSSRAANWRDTLFCAMAPEHPDPEEFPVACRNIILEYSKQVERLGITLFGLLSEALRVKPEYLKDMDCAKGRAILCHYYPACPEPELTMGTTKHSDPDFLSVLLQDHISGLQALHQGQWVDVPPVPGALVVNIGDLLQASISAFNTVFILRFGPLSLIGLLSHTAKTKHQFDLISDEQAK
ncbi:hypothetical protein GIB67_032433 [Kingdonia uniflora]|uniref:Fe2OG dioxygenase domain-containing protein n=1 Tax=Kingdonia uniflora TaxID=39325 RepID=A0A7J7MIZ3_9MAGN|nr:hypothetical protein GIB67_032433 [Kingdonia uniflora]